MLGATAAELFGACILVFIKHPYDISDRVTINSTELIVDKISLLYTEFRRIDNNALVQIPNNVNNANWIDNITKSKAMKERLTFSVSAGTSFADIEALRKEMEDFVQEPENTRDYQPEIDIELISAGDLSKMDLRVEIQHKVRVFSIPAVEVRLTWCSRIGRMRSSVPIEGPSSTALFFPRCARYRLTVSEVAGRALAPSPIQITRFPSLTKRPRLSERNSTYRRMPSDSFLKIPPKRHLEGWKWL
jgi:small-conductance mechanosensitive channel